MLHGSPRESSRGNIGAQEEALEAPWRPAVLRDPMDLRGPMDLMRPSELRGPKEKYIFGRFSRILKVPLLKRHQIGAH